ncbi:MAG: GGDEF domain-containing protein [Thermodesulfobacteriota bacterium]
MKKSWIPGIGLLFILLVGLIRLAIGPEFALSLFYLLPVIATTWYMGKRAGVLISVAAAVTWLGADLIRISQFSKPYIPYINQTFRLVVFLIITVVVDKLSAALRNQRALARVDSLTGIANRRAFFELSKRELDKARRSQTPISVIYIDIDNFKVVNDRAGHSAGDDLLCHVAETLQKNVRSVDVVARLGGDEFCILLSDAPAPTGISISEKVHRILTAQANAHGWPVTFSIGAATFEKVPESVDILITAGDMLMYDAKYRGKNRIQHAVMDSTGQLT